MSGVKSIVSNVAIKEKVVVRNILLEFGGVALEFISSTVSRTLSFVSCGAASKSKCNLLLFPKVAGAKTSSRWILRKPNPNAQEI
jgi:hypothetical protein